MLSIREAMNLAGQNLLHTLALSMGYLPLWRVNCYPDLTAEAEMLWPSHNVGRWWDALLRLEAAVGFEIPAEYEAPMLANLRRTLENPLGVVCHIQPRIGIPPDGDPIDWFDDATQREVLLSLAGLLRRRKDAWAAEAGSRLVRALDGYLLENGDWEFYRMGAIARQAGVPIGQEVLDFYATLKGFALIGNTGRTIEALLEFFLASGDCAALKLAERLARIHLEVSTHPDGTTPEAEHIHTHSLFGTYRGLLLYGILAGKPEYVERIAVTYRVTVRKQVRTSGFISHDLGKEDIGETAAPGDAAQIALWLARAGHPEFLDDVERIVRARILPSQVTADLDWKPRGSPEREEAQNLSGRILGAFGGMISHAHGGKSPTTDITAADLHSLCDIYTHTVEDTPLGLRVNFHFDYEDERIQVRSIRNEKAHLDILVKNPQPVFIRIPGWAPAQSVQLRVNGQPAPVERMDAFLIVSRQTANTQIQVDFDLPIWHLDEVTDGVNYHFTWRGDEIVSISPNTDWLPFYPTGTLEE